MRVKMSLNKEYWRIWNFMQWFVKEQIEEETLAMPVLMNMRRWRASVLVKITSTNICGSDLHMYEGRTDMKKGRVLGHENLGQVVEVGKAVDRPGECQGLQSLSA